MIGTMGYALVPAYLLHSLLYYHFDITVISDDEFDQICREIIDNWDECQKHAHAHLLDKEALVAGSGFQLHINDFPSRVTHMAYKIREDRDYWRNLIHGEPPLGEPVVQGIQPSMYP